MENASKALLMAAGILVAVMVITVGVVLFNSFAGFNQSIIEKLEENKISQFNNNFFKYYGEGKEVTAHDVISMVNIARQNNAEYEIESQTGYNHNSYYIQIQVRDDVNFEKRTESEYNEFIKQNMLVEDDEGKLTKTKLFQCTKIITSNKTSRVIFVKIEDKN